MRLEGMQFSTGHASKERYLARHSSLSTAGLNCERHLTTTSASLQWSSARARGYRNGHRRESRDRGSLDKVYSSHRLLDSGIAVHRNYRKLSPHSSGGSSIFFGKSRRVYLGSAAPLCGTPELHQDPPASDRHFPPQDDAMHHPSLG